MGPITTRCHSRQELSVENCSMAKGGHSQLLLSGVQACYLRASARLISLGDITCVCVFVCETFYEYTYFLTRWKALCTSFWSILRCQNPLLCPASQVLSRLHLFFYKFLILKDLAGPWTFLDLSMAWVQTENFWQRCISSEFPLKCSIPLTWDNPHSSACGFLQSSAHVDRRSMPAMGYMTHTVSAPSLHGKSVSWKSNFFSFFFFGHPNIVNF